MSGRARCSRFDAVGSPVLLDLSRPEAGRVPVGLSISSAGETQTGQGAMREAQKGVPGGLCRGRQAHAQPPTAITSMYGTILQEKSSRSHFLVSSWKMTSGRQKKTMRKSQKARLASRELEMLRM